LRAYFVKRLEILPLTRIYNETFTSKTVQKVANIGLRTHYSLFTIHLETNHNKT